MQSETAYLFAKAVRHQRQGRLDEAEVLYRVCLRQCPHDAEVHYNLGLALQKQGRTFEALVSYEQAVGLAPMHTNALTNMSVAQHELGMLTQAMISARQAISLTPDNAVAHCALAAMLLELGALEESIVESKRSIALAPGLAQAWHTLGAAYNSMNELSEAIAAFTQAIDLDPALAEAHFGLAHAQLLHGQFDDGWREFEWRWKLPEYAGLRRDFKEPAWTGDALNGQTLLIHGEVGLGDAIQFARFVPMVATQNGHVILAVDGRLVDLFRCFDTVSVVDVDVAPLPPFDVHCPLLSLPRVLGTIIDTIPGGVPYLRVENDSQDKEGIPNNGRVNRRLRVGIVWAGNASHRADSIRSPRLQVMLPIFQVPSVDFFFATSRGWPKRSPHDAPPITCRRCRGRSMESGRYCQDNAGAGFSNHLMHGPLTSSCRVRRSDMGIDTICALFSMVIGTPRQSLVSNSPSLQTESSGKRLGRCCQ